MSVDRGYTLLLNHLHNPGSTLPLLTIQGALAHHLATLSTSPSPLAATAISSPFYLSQPITFLKLSSLSTAFRHASHIKSRALVQQERKRSRMSGLFKKSALASMEEWVKDVVTGLQGGHPVLRIASCTGLLLGVEDVKRPSKDLGDGLEVRDARGAIEDEAIVALAEVMDSYTFTTTNGSSSATIEEWEKEFQPAGEDLLSLALIFASQSFPLVSQNKLKALPLPLLAQILTSTVSATFKNGTFLSSVSASVTLSMEQQVHISPTSAFAQTLQSITTSPLTSAIASISRFTSNVMSLLLDSPSMEYLEAVSQTLSTLCAAAKTIEKDWLSTSLASVTDGGVAPDSQEMTKSVWTVLKTFLFSIIMISDGVLSPLIYLSPHTLHPDITPSSLALSILHTFSHLSFVISQFGGVTSTGKGFEELKKTFYLSLDILAWGDGSRLHGNVEAEAYVRQSCIALNSQRAEGNVAFREAKQAFTLASIEQLVPVLGDKCIRDWVWGACYPHLDDASHRETFESAHSVILAIFASHAAQHYQSHAGFDARATVTTNQIQEIAPLSWLKLVKSNKLRVLKERWSNPGGTAVNPEMNATNSEGGASSSNFVQRMVPFYAACLLENSADGRLSTSQLRMAYSALVRSACASAAVVPSSHAALATGDNATMSEIEEKYIGSGGAERYTLGWYCVKILLDTLRDISIARGQKQGTTSEPPRLASNGEQKTPEGLRQTILQDTGSERVHRLHLTLISTISSLPLPLLARVLPEIEATIVTGQPIGAGNLPSHPSPSEKQWRKELVEALFEEILQGVGDREKEYSMKWWYDRRGLLIGEGHKSLLDRLAKGEPVAQSRL